MAYDAAKREPTPRSKSQVNSEDTPELVMTRTRSSHVFKKRTVATEEAVSPDHPFGWQATQRRKSKPKIDQDAIGGEAIPPGSPRHGRSLVANSRSSSAGSRGDPTIPTSGEPPCLDTDSVEKEHQQALRSAVRRVSNGAKRGEPVFQDSPLSPPSGRTIQTEINGPFCYATGLEPVQEFMGNLSLSESSMLSSYPSFEEKKKYLNSLSSFEERPKLLASYSSFGEHCVLGAFD